MHVQIGGSIRFGFVPLHRNIEEIIWNEHL